MDRVGNYEVLFRPGYEIVVPLTKRTKTRYEKHGLPKYLRNFIDSHRRYQGYLYLIHFKEPYKHAKHYLGFSRDPLLRELRHAAGRGSRLMQVIQQEGIEWKIVRLWFGDRYLERRLKKHSSTRYCPVCQGEVSYESVTYERVMMELTAAEYLEQLGTSMSEMAEIQEKIEHEELSGPTEVYETTLQRDSEGH